MGAKDRLEQIASRLDDLKSNFDGLQGEVRQALGTFDGSASGPGRLELDHVNESLRKMVYASTQEEILESYLEEAQSYVQRAILFLNRDGRYVTWKGFGFAAEDIRDIALEDGEEVIVRSANQRQLIYLRDQPQESTSWLDAGDPPDGCVCIPLVFDNTVPVVFYGDSNDAIAIDSLELLTHLAVLVLKNNYLHQALIAEREERESAGADSHRVSSSEEVTEGSSTADGHPADEDVFQADEEVLAADEDDDVASHAAVDEESSSEVVDTIVEEASSVLEIDVPTAEEDDAISVEDAATSELSEFDAIEEALADAHSDGEERASGWQTPTEDDYRHPGQEFQASGQQEAVHTAFEEAESQDFQLEDIPETNESEATDDSEQSSEWSESSADESVEEFAAADSEPPSEVEATGFDDLESLEEEAPQEAVVEEPTPEESAPALSEEESKAHEEAKRFARLLVSEIVLYNKEEVEAGRQNSDLYDRLTRDIERSREMYNKRFESQVSERADYFHDEMIRILANEDGSLMGESYPGPQFGVPSA